MSELDRLVSPVAVTVQCVGTLMLSLMMAQLGRMFGWRYARHWAFGWGALSFGLAAVRISIAVGGSLWWLLYLYAEWTFLFLLIAGCRELTDHHDETGRPRGLFVALPIMLALGILMVAKSATFNQLFSMQALIVAMGCLVAFFTLGRFDPVRRTAGWQLMRGALALMAVLYLAYIPLYWMAVAGIEMSFLSWSSMADLLSALLLGFGMVLVTSEEAHRELNDTVVALQQVQDELQAKLKIDPLTDALNRHAFHSILHSDSGEEEVASGTVIMIDIDHLKKINDEEGHTAGDAAIRATANAVREKIRADDLLFRWGGDEFLLVLPMMTMELVMKRLEPLSQGIRLPEKTFVRAGMVQLSWGGAEFGRERSLEHAIAMADAEMYQRRLAMRRTGETRYPSAIQQ
jgi:diguanylate cyclase (GGDEF)-like protein